MVEIRISNRALKDIKPLPRAVKTRLNEAFVQLAGWPKVSADVKAMQGREGFRMRIGDYRVLFHPENDPRSGKVGLWIDRVKQRGQAYQP